MQYMFVTRNNYLFLKQQTEFKFIIELEKHNYGYAATKV